MVHAVSEGLGGRLAQTLFVPSITGSPLPSGEVAVVRVTRTPEVSRVVRPSMATKAIALARPHINVTSIASKYSLNSKMSS